MGESLSPPPVLPAAQLLLSALGLALAKGQPFPEKPLLIFPC